MKKTIIFLITVLLLCTLCLTACNDHSGEMRDINLLLYNEYSKIEVKVSTVANGYNLEDNYIFETQDGKTNISYVIERLNSFEDSGDAIVSPGQMTTKYEGSAVVENGVLVSVKGEAITPETLQSVSITSMSFKVPYFKNVNTPNNTFSADVIKPQAFLGNDNFDGTDMHIIVRYTQNGLHRIVLEYIGASGSEVSIVYVLTK